MPAPQTTIRETRAIALQIRPFSRTSHIVTWLTEDSGTLTTSIKGACRPKSAFLGQYDLFYTCELLYYIREHDHIPIARECVPLERRDALRTRWREAAVAAYLTDLTARAVPHQPEPGLFQALAASLDALAAGAPASLTSVRYEIILLRCLGLEPNLSPCPACHQPAPAFYRFGLAAGRLLCAHTPDPGPREQTFSLPRGIIDLYRCLASDPLAQELLPPDDTHQNNSRFRNLVLGLSRFLGIFISFHLDVSPISRRVAFEMYHTNQAQSTAPEEIDLQ